MAVSVLNTSAGISGKTLATTDTDQTVTALKTFSRGASPPFAVNSGAAAVANLDADKLDGSEWSAIATDILPATDNLYDLGSAAAKWADIRATAATIATVNATAVNTTNLTAAGEISIAKSSGDASLSIASTAASGLATIEIVPNTGGTARVDFSEAGQDYRARVSRAGAANSDFLITQTGNGGITLTSTGNVLFSVGGVSISITPGGIAFPASQTAVSDANTLDDYEEGDWTPVLGGSGGTSGQTYSVQAGKYVKVGRQVSVTYAMTLTAKGTITTNLQVQGLPFTAENVAGNGAIGPVRWANMTNGAAVLQYVCTEVGVNSTAAAVYFTSHEDGSAATALAVASTTQVANNTVFNGSFTYRASA